MFSKYICSTKEHWWALTSSWLDEVQRMLSTAHELLNVKIYTTDDFHEFYMIDMILCYVFNYYKRRLI